jgi:ATP-binding cassette, subfamily B, bacterial MsbA
VKSLKKSVEKGVYKRVHQHVQDCQLLKDHGFLIREVPFFGGTAVLAIALTLLTAVLEGISVGLILSFLQNLTDPTAPPLQTAWPWLNRWILATHAAPTERLYRVCGLILAVTWLRLPCNYLSQVWSSIAQTQLTERLRIRIFEQFQTLSLSYFSQVRSGALLSSITGEIYQMMQLFQVAAGAVTVAATVAVYLAALLLLSWPLTLLAIALFSSLILGMNRIMLRVKDLSFASTQATRQFSAAMVEYITGVRTVQSFAAQGFERQRFDQINQQIVQTAHQSTRLRSLVDPLSTAGATTILMGILLLAFTVFIPAGHLRVSTLLTFLFALFRLIPSVKQINSLRAQLRSLQGAYHSIRQLLRTDDKPYLCNGSHPFTGLQQAIQFQQVSFGYTLIQPVLHAIDLTIPQGKMTALVGASGAGKTTLVDLISRFDDPTQGHILIDGVDLRDFDVQSLRQRVAVVSQDTFIFNASVRDNIAYGLTGVGEAAIWLAAEQANALEFIRQMPAGLNTLLGDRGVRLSGGQRQRIAIARALLRDPDILILDEATSALDSISERLIQASLEQLTAGRTVIAIAHRLSTITRADQIVVLEQGRIVEQGTAKKLLAKRGQFWRYSQTQRA